MKEKRKKKEGEKGEWRVVGGGRNRRGGCRGAMGSLFRPRVFARANKTRSDGSCSVKLILFLSFFSFFFFLVFRFFGFLVFHRRLYLLEKFLRLDLVPFKLDDFSIPVQKSYWRKMIEW